MSQTCNRCQRIVEQRCQSDTEMEDCVYLSSTRTEGVKSYILTAKETGTDNEITVIANGRTTQEAIWNAWLMPEWVVTEIDYEEVRS